MAQIKGSLLYQVPTWEDLQKQKDAGSLTTKVPEWDELQVKKDQGLLPNLSPSMGESIPYIKETIVPPGPRIPSREEVYTQIKESDLRPKISPSPGKEGPAPEKAIQDTTWGDVVKHSIAAGLYQTSANFTNIMRLIQTGGVKMTDLLLNTISPGSYNPNADYISNLLTGLLEDTEKTVAYNQEQAQSKDWLKNFISSGLQAVPQIATAAFMGAGMPGSTGAVSKMIPFGGLAAGSHSREIEKEGGEYWQQVLGGVLGGTAEVATEMPVYSGITKLLQSTGAIKTVNQGAQKLLQTYGQKGIEFLKDITLQSWQEAEMVPLEKGIKQVLGFPQDWSIKPLIKEMGESAKGGLAMALIMGGLGGGYIGVNQVMNESIQRQEPPEIAAKRILTQLEYETKEETPTEITEQPQENVYYHGSDVDIDKFDISKAKKWNKFGHFFTSDEESAKDYGKIINRAIVKVNNPKVITQKQWWDIRGEHAKDDVWFSNWKKELKEQGYDGLKVLSEETQIGSHTVKSPETLVAFEDSQVEVVKQPSIQESQPTNQLGEAQVPIVEGTGEFRERGVTLHTRERALAEQTLNDFEGNAKYRMVNMEEHAQKAIQLTDSDWEKAKKYATGELPNDTGILTGAIWNAVEDKATRIGDKDTLKMLTSPTKTAEVMTTLGQNIAAFRNNNPDSPVRIVKELNTTMEEEYKKKQPKISIEQVKQKNETRLKEDIKKQIPNKDVWASFIDSITC